MNMGVNNCKVALYHSASLQLPISSFAFLFSYRIGPFFKRLWALATSKWAANRIHGNTLIRLQIEPFAPRRPTPSTLQPSCPSLIFVYTIAIVSRIISNASFGQLEPAITSRASLGHAEVWDHYQLRPQQALLRYTQPACAGRGEALAKLCGSAAMPRVPSRNFTAQPMELGLHNAAEHLRRPGQPSLSACRCTQVCRSEVSAPVFAHRNAPRGVFRETHPENPIIISHPVSAPAMWGGK